ncbi:MAG TPA: hypothetical protein PLH94_00545 [Fimbriimonadaceae bacterium]|nr:hypothetical protein [Fimbriimonadaceae bacterium]
MKPFPRILVPLVIVALTGCAGTDTIPRQANAGSTGTWRGSMTDPSTGKTYAIEFEQVADARGRIEGVARVSEPERSHHSSLVGSRSGDGFSWQADFQPPLGRGRLTATPQAGGGYSLAFEADGQTLGSASGSATRDAGLSDDYSGTWTIVWTVGGDSATFDVTITNSATNDPVYMFVKLPYNGGMVLSGSVVGGQFALTAFSAAGTNGLLTKFLPTSLPGGGAVTGTRVWPGGGDFSGTYTIAKSTN